MIGGEHMKTRRLGKTGLMVSEIGFGGEWLERHTETEGIERKMIKMGCMSIGGRVNPITGSAFSFLTFLDNAAGRSADRKTRPAFLHRQRYPLHDLR